MGIQALQSQLQLALIDDHPRRVQEALSQGANPFWEGRTTPSAIEKAASIPSPSLAKQLLAAPQQCQDEPWIRTRALGKALGLATQENCLETMRLLVAAGAPLDGDSQLHVAPPLGMAKKPEAAQLLLSQGASHLAVDHLQCTPLVHAFMGARSEVVKALIEAGTPIHAEGPYGPYCPAFFPPSMWVVANGRRDFTETLQHFLDAGAPINGLSPQGLSVLMVALKAASVPLVQALLRQGANASQVNPITGEDCLRYARLAMWDGDARAQIEAQLQQSILSGCIPGSGVGKVRL